MAVRKNWSASVRSSHYQASSSIAFLPLDVALPHNDELERVVLGACLLDANAVFTVKRYLKKPESFYLEKHQSVYQAVLRLNRDHGKIDSLTVMESLRKEGLLELPAAHPEDTRLERFGVSPADLAGLTLTVASAAHVEAHCRILYELYMRRKGIIDGYRFVKACADPTEDIFGIYANMARESRLTLPARLLKIESVNASVDRGAGMERKRMMLGNLLKTDEIAFLFGEEGTGKSILAFQMGDAASRGFPLFQESGDESLDNECDPLKTILIDFELDEDELFDRYNANGERYCFNENFFRCYINPEFLDFEDADAHLMNEIEEIIELHKPRFVIIDNITYISSESQDPTIAVKLMKRLKAIQKCQGLSILVVAHTVKNRDKSLPLESRYMAGASGLKNFAKSIIAVGASAQDPDIRYIKHLKCRNGRKIHDADNVIECVVAKPDARLYYEFIRFSTEKAHLLSIDESDQTKEVIERFYDLHKQKKISFRRLAEMALEDYGIRMSHTTIQRKLREYGNRYDLLKDIPEE